MAFSPRSQCFVRDRFQETVAENRQRLAPRKDVGFRGNQLLTSVRRDREKLVHGTVGQLPIAAVIHGAQLSVADIIVLSAAEVF